MNLRFGVHGHQPPVHQCFAQAIQLTAHRKITLILSCMGNFIKSIILYTLKFHLHTLSCHFWLNLWWAPCKFDKMDFKSLCDSLYVEKTQNYANTYMYVLGVGKYATNAASTSNATSGDNVTTLASVAMVTVAHTMSRRRWLQIADSTVCHLTLQRGLRQWTQSVLASSLDRWQGDPRQMAEIRKLCDYV